MLWRASRPGRTSWVVRCHSPRCPPPRTACSRRAGSSIARSPGHRAADPVLPARRRAHRPRALPSLFFVAAAAALAGRPLGGAELERDGAEDDLDALPLEDALDAGERDRIRVRRGGPEAVLAIAAGSPFFKRVAPRRPRRAGRRRLTALRRPRRATLPAALARRLDPLTATRPISASRLAATPLRLPVPAAARAAAGAGARARGAQAARPAGARQPLPRGGRAVPARAARPRRAAGARRRRRRARACWSWPTRRWTRLVAGSPPRFTLLWERERARFHEALLLPGWRARRGTPTRATPAHFEVGFGLRASRATGEPHAAEPLAVDLGDGRTLRVSGKIDRIDRRAGRHAGAARLQDGHGAARRRRALPRRPAAPDPVLRAGRRRSSSPASRVVEAFLDYVDGGRQVALRPRRTSRASASARCCAALVDAIAQGVFVQEPTRLRLLRLQGGLRPAAAAGAAAPVQDRRPARAARPAPAGRGDELRPVDDEAPASARGATTRTSLVLEAGAGTGKTTLLVDRIEALRARGHARARPRSRPSPSPRTPPPP